MALTGRSVPAATTETTATTTQKALIDKVVQLERRLSLIDDTADLGDANTDTIIKETERTA